MQLKPILLHNNFNMETTTINYINVAILGPVSAGKSTLMNSLFVSQYSDMKIKRTTMTPQIYEEYTGCDSSLSPDQQDFIKKLNNEINNKLVAKTENEGDSVTYEDISEEIVYKVPRIYNLHSLPANICMRVFDIPGLNDGKTADLYFKYLDDQFHKFDLLIFVVDINSACNTEGEVRILQKIVEYSKRNRDLYGINNKLIVLANKCDDLHINDNGNVTIEDEELVEMYEQINKEVATQVAKYNPDLEYKICPISAEDSYIYRMYARDPNCKLDIKHVNKFGMNEYGKSRWNRLSEEDRHCKISSLMSEMDIGSTLNQTGFNKFAHDFIGYIDAGSQYGYICGHILYDMKQLLDRFTAQISDNSTPINLSDVQKLYNQMVTVSSLYNSNDGIVSIYKYLDELMTIHRPQLILKEDDITGIISENDLEHYEWAQKHCQKWQNEFGDNFTTIRDLAITITEMLNKYYESNINDKQKPVATLMSRFNKLCANGFKITRKILTSLFTNNDMLNKQPGEIVEIIKDMRTRDQIDNEQEESLCRSLLNKIYDNIYANKSMGYIHVDHIASYVYFVDLFWHDSKLFKNGNNYEYNNEHVRYLAFRARQNMAEKINNGQRGLHPVGLELEKHFISLLC